MSSIFFSAATLGVMSVLWVYRLVLLSENPALAVASVVWAALAGIGLGFAVTSRTHPSRGLLGSTLLAAGLGCLLSLLWFDLPSAMLTWMPGASQGPKWIQWAALVSFTLLPLTSAWGSALAVSHRLHRSHFFGLAAVGLLVGGGTAAGSLLPHLGVHPGLILVALLNLIGGLWLIVKSPSSAEASTNPLPADQKSARVGQVCAMCCLASIGMLAPVWLRLLETFWTTTASLGGLATGLLASLSLGAGLSKGRQPSLWEMAWLQLALGIVDFLSWPRLSQDPVATLVFACLAAFLTGMLLESAGERQKHPGWVMSTGAAMGLAGSLTAILRLPHGMEILTQIGASLSLVGACLALAGAWSGDQSPPFKALLAGFCLAALPCLWIAPRARLTVERFCTFHKDGMLATVRLGFPNPDLPVMTTNSAVQSWADSSDLAGRRLLGYISSFCLGQAKSAAVLGAGGPTLEALKRDHRLQNIDWAVGEAALNEVSEDFTGLYGQALEDDRVVPHFQPLRQFLRESQARYDILLSESTQPWLQGLSDLTSLEFYQLCKDRLSESGIFCQSCDLKSLSPVELRRVCLAFYTVFPNGQAWQLSPGSLTLMGSQTPLKWHPEVVLQMWRGQPDVRQDIIAINIYDPTHLIGYLLAKREMILAQCQGYQPVSDEQPLLRFPGWRVLLGRPLGSTFQERNLLWLYALRGKGNYSMISSAYAWLNLGDLAAVDAIFKDCPETASKAFLQSGVALARGDSDQLAASLKLYPQDYRLNYLAALQAVKSKAWPEAVEHLKICQAHTKEGPFVEVDPKAVDNASPVFAASTGWEYPVDFTLGFCYEALQQWPGAIKSYESAAENSSLSTPLRALGRCLLRADNNGLAQSCFIRALQRNPNDYEAWGYLGQVRIRLKTLDKAVTSLQEAIRLAPANHDARINLAVAYIEQKLPGLARAELNRLLSFFPGDEQALQLLEKTKSQ